MVEIGDLVLRAVIDSCKIYTLNSSSKNKNFENNFIMPNALFGVAHGLTGLGTAVVGGVVDIEATFQSSRRRRVARCHRVIKTE